MANDLEAQLKAHFNAEAEPTTSPNDSTADTYSQVVELIAQSTGVDADSIERESKLDALGATSLALIELTVRLEQRFGIRVSEQAALGFDTVSSVVDYVDQNRTAD